MAVFSVRTLAVVEAQRRHPPLRVDLEVGAASAATPGQGRRFASVLLPSPRARMRRQEHAPGLKYSVNMVAMLPCRQHYPAFRPCRRGPICGGASGREAQILGKSSSPCTGRPAEWLGLALLAAPVSRFPPRGPRRATRARGSAPALALEPAVRIEGDADQTSNPAVLGTPGRRNPTLAHLGLEFPRSAR